MTKFYATKRLLLLAFLALLAFGANAQSTKVTGVVRSASDSRPIAGVTILIDGTQRGTTTDSKGQFLLEVPRGKHLLQVSFLGYKPRTIDIRGNLNPVIDLYEDSKMIDEVVVNIGYGQAKRSDVTGSVQSLSPEDMTGRSSTTVEDLLKGRIAGVQVMTQDGAPGAAASIRIRGGSSINASSEPLYVIDGFPMMADPTEMSIGVIAGTNQGLYTSPLAELNPEDIESIEILKDASATAIYGSRGANGVVLITTKQAQKGATKVSYSGYVTVSIRPTEYELMSNKELQIFNNEKTRYPATVTGNNLYDETRWKNYLIRADSLTNKVDWKKQPNTNWQDAITRIGITHNHQVTITGGNDKTKYLSTLNYYKMFGVVKNTDISRISGRINLDHEIRKWLSFNLNASANWNEHNGLTQASGVGTATGLFIKALTYSPNKTLYSTDEDIESDDDEVVQVSNPFTLIDNSVLEKISKGLNAMGTLTIRPVKGLTLRSSFAAKINNVKQSQFYGYNTGPGRASNGKARVGSIDMIDLLNENTLTYEWKRRGHNLNVMGGLTFETNKLERFVANARNFPYEGLGLGNIGAGTTLMNPSSYMQKWSIMSGLARIQYNYKGRYLATASIRADGSSRFAKGAKWGYFPSVALAWRVSEEKFLKNNSTVSNLKLRASWGQTGNQNIGFYKSMQTYGIGSVNFADAVDKGFYITNVANNGLSWETTSQFDAGAEISFLKNRLSLVLDYYYKISKDLLLNVPVAPSGSGNLTQLMNIGRVRNRGFEASVYAEILRSGRKKLGWTLDFNVATNANKVLSLGTTNYFLRTLNYRNSARDQVIVQVGQPLGTWYGYKTDGLFQYQDKDLDRIKSVIGATPAAGDWKYIDQNNDNVINEDDRVLLGDANPDFYGGIGTTLSYGPLSLRVLFQYSYGGKLLNATRVFCENMSTSTNGMHTMTDRWVGPDWETDDAGNVILENGLPIAIPGSGNPNGKLPRAGSVSNYNLQDTFLEDGSYLRLSNIKLTYRLPAKFCKKIGISNASVYLAGQNLWLWTGYTGSDPEVNMNSSIINGYDFDAYPHSKMITFGLNFNF
ncbi:SusC/RagA family TonB-linked outer membrane protein [Alistipes senegalensis]|uniref:SusC/RagA family TonB-linked outer membrane protein n=2 Tax=Alistipes senegalensis TaxID=1288121 RepID=UPI00242E7CB1|nr:TonB-dependent receptor [Alistipes senegalensis]MDY4571366.1 TonB-dependent receptor [Alistipes senegalensis]